uniref:Carboxylic ester hydrolase n=1 Tax=Steinernema glaseri TaxID=37863 RepID=A0A1I7Y4Z0_9BILA
MLPILVVALFFSAVFGSAPLVETPYGPVEGFELALEDGRTANIFLGIPYAKPPIGELRFEHPQKPSKWEEVKQAKAFSSSCIQHHRKAADVQVPGELFDEDCLTLNVMAPAEKSTVVDGYPVLVFIHGGGFEFGSSHFYGYKNISENFVSEGIVFVSINYRLSALGFFSTGDHVISGNLGLWDQTLALHFVQEAIAGFGGDPDRVTIIGESAGAASVSALTLSPHSNQLFQQAIAMSGSIYAVWAVSNVTDVQSARLAEALGCSGTSTEVHDCMKTKTVEQILDGIEKIGPAREEYMGLIFTPRWDGEFFPFDFDTLLKSAPKIPLITGVSDTEGGFLSMFPGLEFLTLTAVPPEKWATYSGQDLKKYLSEKVVGDEYGSKAAPLLAKMVDYYVQRPKEDGSAMTATDYMERLTLMFSDAYFNIPPYQEALDKIGHDTPVYLYIEQYHNAFTDKPFPVKGSYHGNEIPYLFGSFFGPSFPFDDEDRAFQKNMLAGLTTFIKNGTPKVNGQPWEALSSSSPFKFMSFGPESQMKNGYMQESVEFWLEDVCNTVDLDTLRKIVLPAAKRSQAKHSEL